VQNCRWAKAALIAFTDKPFHGIGDCVHGNTNDIIFAVRLDQPGSPFQETDNMRRTPSSTYRLQLNSSFTFKDASDIADYVSSLGISHIYSSPISQTVPGSTHGYDVADFKAINQELGGTAAQEALVRKLREYGLGQILDIVPNHMSLAQNNPYWRDVLENGPESRYADYFDMDWITGEDRMRNKVLLPLLGGQYGSVLKSGAIKIIRTATRFEVALNDLHLPVAPHSMFTILAAAAEALASETLAFLADSVADLPLPQSDPELAQGKTQRNREVLLSLLTRYLAERPDALDAIDEAIAAVNRDVDALDRFLQQQHYRLAYWKTSNQDLGYRRFFDVNSLIGLRVDRQKVFADMHELIFDWLQNGVIEGVRVDHADGLRDPQQYFDRLREKAPDAWIVAEKILARNETLRESWPVAGTTGYDFLNIVNGLMVSPLGLAELDKLYEKVLGGPVDFPLLVHDSKIAVTAEALGSDVNWLSSIFVEICENDRDHRDHTRAHIRHALREVAACFSVYRTYISPERNELTELDAAVIHNAVEVASQYRTDIDHELFVFIEDVLLLRKRGELESEFLLRFQQFTGPVMAKGFEDTSLYRYNRMIGVNEVGSNPFNPTVSIEEFHRFNEHAQQHHPAGMTALSTHDTKRGEDVRARLAVITEIPQAFGETIDRWFAQNSKYRKDGLPDPNTEYLYYQTLIGAWPLSLDRALLYMEKATREAKQQTSWTQNNIKFEGHLKEFIRQTLNDENFVTEIESFVAVINPPGRMNSLSQTLLKCTAPGVPDLYQGSELWDHRLVDPDNRGSVDFDRRRNLLNEMQHLNVDQVLEQMDSGMPKLWTIQRALQVRQQYPKCFDASGTYTPLEARGDKGSNLVAFLRGDRIAAIAPRHPLEIAKGWGNTGITLPEGEWRNALTDDAAKGGRVKIAQLLTRFPIALLTRES
jgi:(1->4)-alpha-D-glucan 1-alpha-D-glucosylmutase